MRRKNNLYQSRGGFTLIELIIVIVIVGLFLPAMFTMMQTEVVQESQSLYDQQQLSLAEASMEELFADKNAPGRGFTYLSPGNYDNNTGLTGFTRQIEVEDQRVNGRPAKSVRVTIAREGISDISLTAVFIENW